MSHSQIPKLRPLQLRTLQALRAVPVRRAQRHRSGAALAAGLLGCFLGCSGRSTAVPLHSDQREPARVSVQTAPVTPHPEPAVTPRSLGEEAKMDALKLDWTLTPAAADKALLISYTLHNESTETVYLLDHMLVGGGGGAYRDAPKVVIVQDGPKPGAVSLVRGFVRSVQDVTINFVPASRALAPGETLTGQAEVALPLTAWHPNGDSPPLSGTPTQAVLEIGYLRGTPSWSHPPIDTGEKLVVPTFSYTVQHQEFVHGAAKPLPAS